MWNRKNRFEQGLAVAESSTAAAVEQLAGTIRERLDNSSGEQIAGTLNALADRVEALELADQVQQSRRQLQKAARKAGRKMERSGKQIAALSAQAVPEEPQGWIAPTFLGFLVGFGLGFLVARSGRRRAAEQHG
jgi:uncharacterized protein YdbL (DUF1318 family)